MGVESMRRRRGVCVAELLPLVTVTLIMVLLLGTWDLSPHQASHPPVQGISPAGSVDTLSYDGVDPTVISLFWAHTTDICFSNYTLQYSLTSSNGPWYVIWSTTNSAQTSIYVYGLTPGATYWWEIVDNDFCTGPATSNALQVTQPAVASLSYSTPSESSVSLNWTNNAAYGGWVGFGSYTVLESINGGSFSAVTTIASASTTTYLVNGLSPSTLYGFEVQTTDNVSQSTLSNSISFSTPAALTVTVSASRTTADVGQPVAFTCAATGGERPYVNYSWSFGDNGTGSTWISPFNGSTATHVYSTTGVMNAICTVTDLSGTQASGGTIVMISPDPQITGVTFTPSSAGPPADHGIDVGQTLTLTANASGGFGAYNWSWLGLPPTCSGMTTGTVHCTPTSPGNYTVNVWVTDRNGFNSTSSRIVVHVFPLPTVFVAVSPSSLLEGRSVTFVAVVPTGAGGLTYSWSGLPPGCAAPSGPTLTCSPTASGTFRVVVTVTDQNGGTGVGNVTLTVNAAFLGMPAAQGYAIVGGGISAVVVAAVVALLVVRRRRKGGKTGAKSQNHENPATPPPPPGTT